MRVKTVPRQRAASGNRSAEPVSEAGVPEKIDEAGRVPGDAGDEETRTTEDGREEARDAKERAIDDSDANRSAIEEATNETASYPEEALDMSIKHKADPGKDSLAGPSSCRYADTEEDPKDSDRVRSDDNNNIIIGNPETEQRCLSTAGSSSREDSKSCDNKSTSASSSDDDRSPGAVNLCKKDCQDEDEPSNQAGSCDERLKDTFLYKIMTDPAFLESIQKHKQTKRYMCQFCKQEFVSGDELADHMDVKKDESNQVVCCACKKTFAQKRYLRYHQRCHSERTKFTCDICTKKYTRMDNLSRHNAFHVNPDKFSCTYCEKTFARKDLLNKHLKCHDNKYRFYCETCQKYFKGPLTLDNHRKNFHSVT